MSDVTVVVCTYNRAELLRETLDSLMRLQTRGEFRYEILVVDNNSADDTPRVIAEAAARSPVPLRGAHEPRPGVACARNRGVSESTTPWIAFFDDDQTADPNWLRELLDAARAKQARCIGGANRLHFPGGEGRALSPVCRGLLGEGVGRAADFRYHPADAPGAGNLLLHRSVFDEVGGFDEGLREAGEDADLFRRMWSVGIDGWYTPRAIMYHAVPAYRLKREYFRWKALRNGSHVARRDYEGRGAAHCLLSVTARLAQALVLRLPRLLWQRLRGADEDALGTRCLIWRTEGYCRYALCRLAPRSFAQRAFFEGLEFRSERELFGPV